jgi:hypothetical protein
MSNNRCVYREGRCRINRKYSPRRSRSPARLTAEEDYDYKNNWTREELEAKAIAYGLRGGMTDRQRYAALRRMGVLALRGSGMTAAPYVPYPTPYVPTEYVPPSREALYDRPPLPYELGMYEGAAEPATGFFEALPVAPAIQTLPPAEVEQRQQQRLERLMEEQRVIMDAMRRLPPAEVERQQQRLERLMEEQRVIIDAMNRAEESGGRSWWTSW